jgi:hypothetical protein
MSSTLSRGVRLAAAVAVGLLAIPVFGVLLWGALRLLFWGVVDASPHVRGVHPAGMPVPGPIPSGTGSLLIHGGFGSLPVVLLAFVALAVVVAAAMSLVSSHNRGDDDAREDVA